MGEVYNEEDYTSLICKYAADCVIDEDDPIIIQWQHMLRDKNVVYNQDYFASKLYYAKNNRTRDDKRKRLGSYVCMEFPSWNELNEDKKHTYHIQADKLRW